MSTAAKLQFPFNDFLPVRPDWIALYEEQILEPDLPIVDSRSSLDVFPVMRASRDKPAPSSLWYHWLAPSG